MSGETGVKSAFGGDTGKLLCLFFAALGFVTLLAAPLADADGYSLTAAVALSNLTF